MIVDLNKFEQIPEYNQAILDCEVRLRPPACQTNSVRMRTGRDYLLDCPELKKNGSNCCTSGAFHYLEAYTSTDDFNSWGRGTLPHKSRRIRKTYVRFNLASISFYLGKSNKVVGRTTPCGLQDCVYRSCSVLFAFICIPPTFYMFYETIGCTRGNLFKEIPKAIK